MNEDEAEKRGNRVAAAEAVSILRALVDRAIAEMAAIGRWIVATLVVINGAGAVAVVSAPIESWARVAAGACFIVAIVAALGAAFGSLKLFARTMEPMGKWLGYYVSVVDDGERIEEMEEDLRRDVENAAKDWRINVCAWLSVILFIVGAVVIGLGFITSPIPPP